MQLPTSEQFDDWRDGHQIISKTFMADSNRKMDVFLPLK